MLDLHTHTLISDGVLTPAELIRRAEVKGYRGLVISDHVDNGTLAYVVGMLVRGCGEIQKACRMKIVPGVEITHCRPGQIADLVAEARRLGAGVVLVHGETIVEPVLPGTNRAAIEAGADVLAHPGLLSEEDAYLAREKDVHLEVSGRKGHSLTNGHVTALARKVEAKLVFGSDAHEPGDIFTRAQAEEVLLGAGLVPLEVAEVFRNMERLLGL